eukprot:COSAG02_NODE_5138_length_4595_cov_7.217749_3_plen_762_part_00
MVAEFTVLRCAPPTSLQNSAAVVAGVDGVALLCDAAAAGGVGISVRRVADGAPVLELRSDEATGTPDAQAWSADGGTLAVGIGRELHIYAVSHGAASELGGLRMIWRALLHFHCKAVAVVHDSQGATRVAVGGADGILLFCGPREPTDTGNRDLEPEPEQAPTLPTEKAPCVAAVLSLMHHAPVCSLAFAEGGVNAGVSLELAAGTVDGRLVVCTLETGGQDSGAWRAHELEWPLGEEGGGGLRRVTALSYRPPVTRARVPVDRVKERDRTATPVLAIACWDGSVHLLSAHSFARDGARNAADSTPDPQERVNSRSLSRWRYSTPRLVRDIQTAETGSSGGDSIAMANGAGLLCWSPDGDKLVLALSGELHVLTEGQQMAHAQTGSAADVELADEWIHHCTPRHWRLLRASHGSGDQKLQIKGLAKAENCLVVVSRMPTDRCTAAVVSTQAPTTPVRGRITASGSDGNGLMAVTENRTGDGDVHTLSSAPESIDQPAASEVSTRVCCIDWASIMHRHPNAAGEDASAGRITGSVTTASMEFPAGTVRVVAETDIDEAHCNQQCHCPVVDVIWSHTEPESAQHRIVLKFAARGVHLLPYTCIAARRATKQYQGENDDQIEDHRDENQDTELQAEPWTAHILIGTWGLAVLYDGSVYIWLRAQGRDIWRLVVTPARARALCVGEGRMPQSPTEADMQRANREGRWWWLAVEDDQEAVAMLPLAPVSEASRRRSDDSAVDAGRTAGACVDGDLPLWEKVHPELR